MPQTIVSFADFSRMCGVSRKTVSSWAARGLLVVNADGKVLVAESDRSLRAYGGNIGYRGNAAARA
jgi:hypothetical protein